MANDSIQPPGEPPDNKRPLENESAPRDDSGINNDHILDLCDFIINTAWSKYIGNGTGEVPSIQELESLSNTTRNVWRLAQEIIDLDRRLRLIAEFGDIPPEFFEEDNDEKPEGGDEEGDE